MACASIANAIFLHFTQKNFQQTLYIIRKEKFKASSAFIKYSDKKIAIFTKSE